MFSLLPLLLVVPAALAAPFTLFSPKSLDSLQESSLKDFATSFPQGCSTSRLTVPLPSGQTNLTVPSGQKVSTVTVGRGIQNYTCTNGAYVSAGAVANLYDVSCVFQSAGGFASTAALSEALPLVAYASLEFPDTRHLPVAVHHFFVSTPGSTTAGAISPEFAAANDRVIVSKVGQLNAANASDVPWLELAAIQGQGTFARSVFRINTVSGQPPSSCTTEGEKHSTPYAAMYWFTS